MSLEVLQQRLGYRFEDEGKLRSALTHKSAGADNFERFEFLGDAALGFIVARALFDAWPETREHGLTLMRASLVNTAALAELARGIDLGAFVRLGEGARKTGVANRDSVLADALEALIGAIVCDGGFEAATALALRLFEHRLHSLGDDDLRDAKTRLQEYLHARRLPLPKYEVTGTEGRAHTPVFFVACSIDQLGIRAAATGGSRRAAEKVAAARVLRRLQEPTGETSRDPAAPADAHGIGRRDVEGEKMTNDSEDDGAPPFTGT